VNGIAAAEDERTAAAGAGVVAALRAAADFIEKNKAARVVDSHSRTNIYRFCDTTGEIDEIAGALELPAQWVADDTHYQVIKEFGTEVAYYAVYIMPVKERWAKAASAADAESAPVQDTAAETEVAAA
jgi:hypothetical protein